MLRTRWTTPGSPAPDPTPDGSPGGSEGEDPWIRCRTCDARLAREKDRIAIRGSHTHELMNPGGLRFLVGCFAAAAGLVAVGPRSTVWTWFPGHAWQAVCCGKCGEHLGWSFRLASEASDDTRRPPSFYGLVLDRLT